MSEISATLQDMKDDTQAGLVMDPDEQCIAESVWVWNAWQHSLVNSLPQTKVQLKKTQETMRLQEAKNKSEAERNQRLKEIPIKVVQNLSAE